jgi:AraC-like DNA-binding protein
MLENRMNSMNEPYLINCHYADHSNCNIFSDFDSRRTKWYELEFILKGGGCVITGSKKYYPKKGDLFFRKPGTITQSLPPYCSYLISFDIFDEASTSMYAENNWLFGDIEMDVPDISSDRLEDIPSIYLPPVFNIQQYDKVKENFEEIYNKNGNVNNLYLSNCIAKLLSIIEQEWQPISLVYNSRRSVRLNYHKVMRVKKYIDNNVYKRIKLSELAEIAGLSTGFLDRIFKEIIGETPVSYINKGRIEAVKKMLLETDKSVKQIAYDCGFENDVYFYMLFKKIEGVSPLTFKDSNTF